MFRAAGADTAVRQVSTYSRDMITGVSSRKIARSCISGTSPNQPSRWQHDKTLEWIFTKTVENRVEIVISKSLSL
jgi:hypothetical protein